MTAHRTILAIALAGAAGIVVGACTDGTTPNCSGDSADTTCGYGEGGVLSTDATIDQGTTDADAGPPSDSSDQAASEASPPSDASDRAISDAGGG